MDTLEAIRIKQLTWDEMRSVEPSQILAANKLSIEALKEKLEREKGGQK